MIKQLKKKIIIINMSIVSVILLTLFISICIITYKTQAAETFRILESSIAAENKRPPINDFSPPKNEAHMPFMNTVKITLNSNKEIVSITNGEAIDSELLRSAVEYVIKSSEDKGRISGSELMYLKHSFPTGVIIALTSTERIDSLSKNVIIISLILMIISLMLFFVLSERLAHYATEPVSNAWKNQKQFVSDASHDLKTPLTVILANNDILLSHKDSTVREQEKWIESTIAEATQMKVLVEQMLDLAKSENQSDASELTRENISEATEKIILQLEPIAYEKNVTIESKIPSDVFINTCISSYLRIAQALVDNAIKYSKPGEKAFVELREDRQRAFLCVRNSAYIIPEDLTHIFERFYRGDKSRNESGHGLGLAIAKNLAISLGGDLGVKSSLEYGTTFVLVLKK